MGLTIDGEEIYMYEDVTEGRKFYRKTTVDLAVGRNVKDDCRNSKWATYTEIISNDFCIDKINAF